MMVDPNIIALLEITTIVSLLLVAVGLVINSVAAVSELWRCKILRRYFGGKAKSDGFLFTVNGLQCKVWHNRYAVPLEIELKREPGRLMILGPQSLWGLEKGLPHRRDLRINKQLFIIGSDNQALLKNLTTHPKFHDLITALFHRSNPYAMWIQIRSKKNVPRQRPVLIFSALPEGIYRKPKFLENTVNQIAEVFQLQAD